LATAMLLYKLGVVLILGMAGLWSQPAGVALWPVIVLHTVIGIWCVGSLRRNFTIWQWPHSCFSLRFKSYWHSARCHAYYAHDKTIHIVDRHCLSFRLYEFRSDRSRPSRGGGDEAGSVVQTASAYASTKGRDVANPSSRRSQTRSDKEQQFPLRDAEDAATASRPQRKRAAVAEDP